jgi:hypothetical protein
MKRVSAKTIIGNDDIRRVEYDFTEGVRGKHFRAMQSGYKITIRQSDGTTIVKEVAPVPEECMVVLSPDIREYFPDSESVNTALRSLINLIPVKQCMTAKEPCAK